MNVILFPVKWKYAQVYLDNIVALLRLPREDINYVK